MKANFFFDFIILKIFITYNHFIFSSSLGNGKRREDEIEECKIGKDINTCLNNIFIFENTNGDIYLKEKDSILIFGTTLSNKEQRAFYALYYDTQRYIIKNEDNILVPFIIKNMSRTENKEIYNEDLSIYNLKTGYIINTIVVLFGTDGSYIEALHINNYANNFTLVSPNDFINDNNKVIKGISSLFYFFNKNIIYGTVTITKNNNVSDYTISIYGIKSFSYTEGNFNYKYTYKIEYDDIKGEYLSCFVFNDKEFHISCFYLNKYNNYTIIFAKSIISSAGQLLAFSKQSSFIFGCPSNPNDTNFYFIKAISLGTNYCSYMYYSGDSNDIPTFLFKTILDNFTLIDTYSNFPVIYLKEKYEFNNGIKYNDLSFTDSNEIYFVSSSKNKETIIIAYLYFYSTSQNEPKNKLVIRYYTLELKKYYNMKIFHVLKTTILSPSVDKYLSLAFDFSYSNSSSNQDELISNAGFIIFSYPNISIEKRFDFIELAFNNNTNYIIVDLMEDAKIENNIFGYILSSIMVYINEFEGVKYILVNSGEVFNEEIIIYQNDSLIKIVLEDGYSFEEMEISFDYYLIANPSYNINEINEYCDEINDTYGDKNDYNSNPFKVKKSIFNVYYININKNLKTACNDSNCILCLDNEINYCIVCKGKYKFIFGDEYLYKKKKICEEVQIEVNNTDNFSNNNIFLSDIKTDELSNSEKIISDKLTYYKEATNNIKTEELSNEKLSLTDYESSNTKLIKTDDMIYKKESDSNNNEGEVLTDINTEVNTYNTNEISNKRNFSDIYKDELTNIKEDQSDSITNKISNENKMANDSANSLSYNIYSAQISYEFNTTNLSNKIFSDEKSYEFNNDELSENKTINDINSFKISTDFYKDEISNTIENSNKSDTNENIILSESDSTSNKSIINTEKISYINNISTDNFFTNKYNILNTDKLTNIIRISIEDLMNGKFKDINLSKEQLQKLYEIIKEYIKKEYNGDNIILNTSNVKIQISNIDAQKYSEELSNIDLGKCGEILKEKYCKKENDSLIMLKFDIKPENETSTYVQYEIYEPLSGKFLNLEECSENKVSIDVPINLDSEIEGLYKWLAESGYNLFDSNDIFYNDICATFTTQNGTDILLYDRRMDIYQSTVNISLCQDGCDFQYYNVLTKKAKCDCFVQNNQINIDLSELKFDKNTMIEQFYETLDNSNFRVLKCYKLVFNFQIFKKNIGCIIMTILLALFEILIVLYLILGTKKVNEFIQIIIKGKYFNNNNTSVDKKIIKFEDKNRISHNNINVIKTKRNTNRKMTKKKKTLIKKSRRKSVNYDNNLHLEKIRNVNKKKTCMNINLKSKLKEAPPKRRVTNKIKDKKYMELNMDSQLTKLSSKKSSDFPNSKDNMVNLNSKSNPNSQIKRKNKKMKSKRKVLDIYRRYKDKKKLSFISKNARATMILSPKRQSHKIYKEKDLDIYRNNTKKKSFDKKEKLRKEFNNLNTAELNNLEYEKAILLDKRTYWQYYFSLLKKKHLILFTFLPTNDYNLMSLKISLFLVSFSLYLNVNAFFFNDETMHKIYEDSGVFNVIARIPQILYSSIISSFINMILKALSLSEKDILKIKDEKSMISTVKKSKKIEKCIKIKFIFFFLISLILMLFFWYFISCFCAVYNNTQVILFKDTLISFSLSMLYPIGINLIPGIFRIASLRAKNKNKKCMYSFSKIIALI